MNIINVDINKLIDSDYNPRIELTQEDEEYQSIKRSIESFGYVQPIIINSNYEILAGHQRKNVLLDLGRKKVDCVLVKLSKKKEKALNVAMNKIDGKWDDEKLLEVLRDIKVDESDFLLTGFNETEFDDLFKKFDAEGYDYNKSGSGSHGKDVVEDDYDETNSLEKQTDIKKGDIYILGNHRLMCGDSTNKNDIELLMNSEKAILAHNDPPYGMKKEKDGIENDNLNYDDLLEFNKQWINLQLNYLVENGSWYCWGIDEPLMDVYGHIIKPIIKNQKATFRNLITWDKINGQGQMSEEHRMYATADEKCLFIMCGVHGFNSNKDNYFEGWEPIRDYLLKSRLAMRWSVADMKTIVGHSDKNRDHWTNKSQFSFPTREVYNKMKAEADKLRNETNNDAFKKEYDAFKKEYDELKKEYDELKNEYYKTRAYFDNTHDNMNSVWHFERTSIKEKESTGNHATPKPLKLCERVIKSSSKVNDLVIDFFGGSGSTLIACEQLERKCYMMEISPQYCQVIIDRWEEFTGKEAKKIN